MFPDLKVQMDFQDSSDLRDHKALQEKMVFVEARDRTVPLAKMVQVGHLVLQALLVLKDQLVLPVRLAQQEILEVVVPLVRSGQMENLDCQALLGLKVLSVRSEIPANRVRKVRQELPERKEVLGSRDNQGRWVTKANLE